MISCWIVKSHTSLQQLDRVLDSVDFVVEFEFVADFILHKIVEFSCNFPAFPLNFGDLTENVLVVFELAVHLFEGLHRNIAVNHLVLFLFVYFLALPVYLRVY